MTTDGSRALAEVPLTLEELIDRVAVGDEQAFAHLFDAVSPRVLAVALRVLRDPAQAEEIAQEAMIDVWRSAPRYDAARGGVLSWVLTITHRRAVDRVRSEQAAGEREERAGVRDAQTPHDEVAEQVETRLEHAAVRDCMGTLTGLQHEAIQLAYWKGYTYRQVAEVLSAPLGTVKARMRDGLIRLRDCLESRV